LLITPRYIHYNITLASRSQLTLDSTIPPLLHTCHESRTFALEHYKLYTLGTRRLYLHLVLDTVLWIRYPSSSSSSRAFRTDAQRLLLETEAAGLEIPNFAISAKFWGRIVTKEIYRDLYERTRDGGIRTLSIVDDAYGSMECERVKGARVSLKKWRRKVTGKGEELWKMWDDLAGAADDGGEREGQLPEVGFKRVVFILKS
jgi:2EXR family